jgi:EmrB/QacA subfamily drug resistance transporter
MVVMDKAKHKGIALAILATGQFMVVLDATIVNVALPAIQKALGFANDAQLQWIITAYALTFGGFLMLGGRLADLFGRRRIFLSGVTLFALASLAGGLSQNPTMLITLRMVQGIGGALLAPAALSLVLNIFEEGQERNKALGVWSMVAGGGGAVGLLLGGILTQYIDWRWIFFINVPIAAIVFFMTTRFVPKGEATEKQRIDYAGALTLTAGLVAIVYALAEAAQKGWGSHTTIASFAAAAVLLFTFIVNEQRVKHPLVPLAVFKRRNVTGGSLLGLLMPAALFGMFFYLSIYLQQILHYSPTKTGVADIPFTLILILVAGVLSGKIAKINPKPILVLAPLVVGAGLVYFARIPLHANYWTDIFPGIALMASGMAAVFVTNTVVTSSGASKQEAGLISGLLNTGQQIGGAIGLAVLSVVSTALTKHDIAAAHGNQSAVPAAMVHGFQRGFLVAALFTLLGSIISLLVLRAQKPSTTDIAREMEEEAEALPAIPGV